jgi:hypothetical protein
MAVRWVTDSSGPSTGSPADLLYPLDPCPTRAGSAGRVQGRHRCPASPAGPLHA